jgi:hypothetical protein
MLTVVPVSRTRADPTVPTGENPTAYEELETFPRITTVRCTNPVVCFLPFPWFDFFFFPEEEEEVEGEELEADHWIGNPWEYLQFLISGILTGWNCWICSRSGHWYHC